MAHLARIFVALHTAGFTLGMVAIARAGPLADIKPKVFAPGVISSPALRLSVQTARPLFLAAARRRRHFSSFPTKLIMVGRSRKSRLFQGNGSTWSRRCHRMGPT